MKKICLFLVALTAFTQLEAQVLLDCGDGSYDAFDAKFRYAGKLHNAHLDNIVRKFEERKDITDYESGVNYIKGINDEFFKNNQEAFLGDEVQSPEFVASVSQSSKYYVNNAEFREKLLSNEGETSLTAIQNKVKSTGMLDNGNYRLYAEVTSLIRSNVAGQLSSNEFELGLGRLANDWLKVNEGKENSESAMFTGSIITIGLKSCQFWRENADLIYDSPSRIPTQVGPQYKKLNTGTRHFVPVVALDAAGALVSAAAVSLNQYINTGHVSAGAVVTGAVIGAVTGSTGLVGKVAKWLTSLF